MLEGTALFAGYKEFVSKQGEKLRICKLVDGVSGEMAEVFVNNDSVLPSGIAIMSPVKVCIDWCSFGGRTNYTINSISQAGK